MSIPKWLVKLSVLVNHLTCGPKGYSLCTRFYEWRLEGSVVGKMLVKITDKLFFFDPQHCRKSWLRRQKR